MNAAATLRQQHHTTANEHRYAGSRFRYGSRGELTTVNCNRVHSNPTPAAVTGINQVQCQANACPPISGQLCRRKTKRFVCIAIVGLAGVYKVCDVGTGPSSDFYTVTEQPHALWRRNPRGSAAAAVAASRLPNGAFVDSIRGQCPGSCSKRWNHRVSWDSRCSNSVNTLREIAFISESAAER